MSTLLQGSVWKPEDPSDCTCLTCSLWSLTQGWRSSPRSNPHCCFSLDRTQQITPTLQGRQGAESRNESPELRVTSPAWALGHRELHVYRLNTEKPHNQLEIPDTAHPAGPVAGSKTELQILELSVGTFSWRWFYAVDHMTINIQQAPGKGRGVWIRVPKMEAC